MFNIKKNKNHVATEWEWSKLQIWLSEDEYAQFDIEWQEQLKLREELKDKPSELKRYEDKLKEAIIMRNRSDAYHRKGKKSAAYKLDGKCESLCEDALEILIIWKLKYWEQ